MAAEMSDEFVRAVQRVAHDVALDGGHGADLIAVGVKRADCLALLAALIEDGPCPPPAEVLAMVVQFAVATGVWIERERWQSEEGGG